MNDLVSKKTAGAYVTNVCTSPAYWMIGICWRMLATGVQTGGPFILSDRLLPPRTGVNTHVHPQEEGLYIASGRCIFQAGGKVFEAGPGLFVNIPRHNEHSFLVEEDTHLVNFYLPADFDIWLMGGAILAEPNDQPQPSGSPQRPHALIEQLATITWAADLIRASGPLGRTRWQHRLRGQAPQLRAVPVRRRRLGGARGSHVYRRQLLHVRGADAAKSRADATPPR